MKTLQIWLSILSILFSSCRQEQRQAENKLERQFKDYVVRKQYIKRIECSISSETDTISYFTGYDSLDRIVNNGNHQFYEYDSLGRILKQYQCVLSRDPTCSKPYIYFYEYSNGNLEKIKLLNSFTHDSIPRVVETFIYDRQNRLVQHTKFPSDTFTYVYIGADTCKHSELRTYWVNNADGESVKVSKKTTFQYDSLGRIVSLTWADPDDGMTWRNDFFFDAKNRLIMKKDSSLDNYNREPNSCCILYWTEYKYDSFDRLIEEIHSTGSYDKPKPQFQRSIKFEY